MVAENGSQRGSNAAAALDSVAGIAERLAYVLFRWEEYEQVSKISETCARRQDGHTRLQLGRRRSSTGAPPVLTTVRCHGSLAELLPDPVTLDVQSCREAVHALSMQVRGFHERIVAGRWHVLRGTGLGPLQEPEQLDLPPGEALRIVPAVEGAGGKTGSAVLIGLGVALVGASFFLPPAGGVVAGITISQSAAVVASSFAVSMGVALAVTGVAGLLASDPPSDDKTREGSNLMGGDVNVVSSGAPIPLIYGRVRVGSIVASGGISTVPVS